MRGNEILHLLISFVVLWIAFVNPNFTSIFTWLTIGIGVGTGFLIHELAHRTVARKKGLAAGYIADPYGLMMALFLSFISGGVFVFAAPGGVVIRGLEYLSKDERGKIAIAGPLTNIFIGLLLSSFAGILPALWSHVFRISSKINFFLAGFNLIPFGNLDGRKIFQWSKKIDIGLLVLVGVLYFLI